MAKIYGLFGAMKGKVADVVMTVRNGEQIVRKYQPIVTNPSSPAQVEVRAKLKLMSQLSAVMSPYIAIPRMGTKSSRNLFVKKNYPLSSYADNTANITLASVQLTNSVVGMPSLITDRNAENPSQIDVRVARVLKDVDRVVYVAFSKGADDKLRAMGSSVATSAGSSLNWPAVLEVEREAILVLAYAVRDNSELARATFGNMQAVTSESVAKLIVNRVLTESDVTLTETVGSEVPAYVQQNGNIEGMDTRSSKKK